VSAGEINDQGCGNVSGISKMQVPTSRVPRNSDDRTAKSSNDWNNLVPFNVVHELGAKTVIEATFNLSTHAVLSTTTFHVTCNLVKGDSYGTLSQDAPGGHRVNSDEFGPVLHFIFVYNEHTGKVSQLHQVGIVLAFENLH
jgi:hypothetical protein